MRELAGEEELKRITESNPLNLINGEKVECFIPEKIVREEKKKSFWNRFFG